MKNVFEKSVFSVLFCVCIMSFFAVSASAQDLDNVSISGKVVDSNDAPLGGATVTATLTTTGIERTVTTNESGNYRIVALTPGIYTVKFSANGFGAKEQADLNTVAGQNVQLNISLAPAGVAAEQTIVIDGDDAPLVDTTRTVVGGTITEREIGELPVNSRNPLDLVLTLGGTAEEALSVRDLAEDRNQNPNTPPLEQGNFSLSGGASYSNNITIDGLDNNDDRSSLDRFQPPIDSIAEVQVITNQFSSEYGRASGGRVNLRTRAGSNRFRGRAFMYFRDDNLNANSWYNNSRGFARLPLTEYNPGFTFSGPVIIPFGEGKSIYNGRNKTFFSVAYEYGNVQDTTLIDTFVPVGTNPRFTLPQSTGGAQTCDQAAIATCTSNPPTAAYVAPYQLSVATPALRHAFTGRVDHKLFKNNDFTVGFQYGRRNNRRSRFATTNRLDETIQGRISDTQAINFTDNHIFGPNTVNQFRFQYSLFEPSYQTENPNNSVVLISIRNPLTNARQTLTAGNSSVSGSASDEFAGSRREDRWQFQDSVTYIFGGKHTFKAGFDLQRVNSIAVALSDSTGTFNFNSVLDYQNNVLLRFRQNIGNANNVRNTYYGMFINDEFKLRQNLTLNLGLRYERETALNDSNNFGPRAGVAWDPFKKGRSVIRLGAGIFYNRALLRTVADYIQNSSPGLAQFDTNLITTTNGAQANVLARIAQQFPSGFASAADIRNLVGTVNCGTAATPVACSSNTGFLVNTGSAGNPLRTVDADLKIPESYQYNVGFEQQIGKGFVFEANYTLNKTTHLWRDVNANAPVLPAGYEDWTAYLLANTFTLRNGGNGSTSRTYRFVLGSTTDESGISRDGGGSCSTSQTNTCVINLNTFNDSTTTPTATTLASGGPGGSVGAPIGIARLAISRFRPDPTINDEKSRISSIGNSFYHGLVLELRSRYRKLGYGFSSSMRAAYTLSSFQDDGLNNTSNAEVNGDFSREFTRNNQDRRHRFALSGTFDTPWWFGKLRFSPLFRYGSSAPFNFGIGVDRNLDDLSTDRLNYTGDIKDIIYRQPNSPFPTELLSRFSLQPIGAKSGNLARNAGTGPSFYTFDLSVAREWKFKERFRIRPNIEFDNILNAAVFSYGAQFIDFLPNDTTPTAAQLLAYQNILIPTRTFRQRQIRLGLRFDF
jgi:Carboxypeptidase regulatory-like domain/TonB dependent receptor